MEGYTQFPKVVASRKNSSGKEMGPSMVVEVYFSFVSKTPIIKKKERFPVNIMKC